MRVLVAVTWLVMAVRPLSCHMLGVLATVTMRTLEASSRPHGHCGAGASLVFLELARTRNRVEALETQVALLKHAASVASDLNAQVHAHNARVSATAVPFDARSSEVVEDALAPDAVAHVPPQPDVPVLSDTLHGISNVLAAAAKGCCQKDTLHDNSNEIAATEMILDAHAVMPQKDAVHDVSNETAATEMTPDTHAVTPQKVAPHDISNETAATEMVTDTHAVIPQDVALHGYSNETAATEMIPDTHAVTPQVALHDISKEVAATEKMPDTLAVMSQKVTLHDISNEASATEGIANGSLPQDTHHDISNETAATEMIPDARAVMPRNDALHDISNETAAPEMIPGATAATCSRMTDTLHDLSNETAFNEVLTLVQQIPKLENKDTKPKDISADERRRCSTALDSPAARRLARPAWASIEPCLDNVVEYSAAMLAAGSTHCGGSDHCDHRPMHATVALPAESYKLSGLHADFS